MGSYASEYRTFFYNLKRYGFSLSSKEIKQMIITVLIIAFVWSFNKWGDVTFDFVAGLKNFLLGALYAAIGLIINQIGQRIVAVYYGYDPTYEYGIIGLMIALVITFASRGWLIFFLPGGVNVRHLTASRLGEFRYYTNDWEWAKGGFTGPFFNIILVILCSFFKEIPFVRELMIMNIMFAVYSLVPIPGNLGLYLFYPHVYFWSFTLGIVAGSSLAAFFLPPLFSFLIGIFAGVFAMYWHYVKKDDRLHMPWEGEH
ncbi:MAG: hypothetical protein ABIJ34_05340 [archaeon]